MARIDPSTTLRAALLFGVVALAACGADAPPPAAPSPTVREVGNDEASLRYLGTQATTLRDTAGFIQAAHVARFDLLNRTEGPWLVFGTRAAVGLVVPEPLARIDRRNAHGRWESAFDASGAPQVPPDSELLGPDGHVEIAVVLPPAMALPAHAGASWRVCVAADAAQEACSEGFALGEGDLAAMR
jgi:hypothetical protein